MTDNGLVVVAVCGLALVCLGVVAVGAFVVLRATGHRLLGRDDASGEPVRVLSSRRARLDLQAQADALDFDAALAQAARQRDQPLTHPTAPPMDSLPEPPRPPDRVITPPWEAEESPGLFIEDADDAEDDARAE